MKNIFIKNKIGIIILIVALIILNTQTVNAITPSFNKKSRRGTNIKYYINEGDLNVFQQREHITNAVKNWEHTGFGYNPVYMKRINSSKGTGIDFYSAHNDFFGSNDILGRTYFYDGYDRELNPDKHDWLYARVYLNLDTLAPIHSYAQIQGTIAHEIGHAFGLAHYNNNPNGSIMCQTGYRRVVQTVQKEDNEAINAKY